MVGINAPNRLLAGWMPKSAVLQFTQRDFANPASATAETVTERVLLRQLSCEDDYDIAIAEEQQQVEEVDSSQLKSSHPGVTLLRTTRIHIPL